VCATFSFASNDGIGEANKIVVQLSIIAANHRGMLCARRSVLLHGSTGIAAKD
jgi:hypothetical protein